MDHFSIDLLSLPTLSAFLIMVLINAAVTRVTLTSIKSEVEKLEKKLDQLHTQLMKIAVLETRLGHLEKDLSKAQTRLETIENAFILKINNEEY